MKSPIKNLSLLWVFIACVVLMACSKASDPTKIEPAFTIELATANGKQDEKLLAILQETLDGYSANLHLPDHIETTEDQERYAAFQRRQIQSLLNDRLRAEGFYQPVINYTTNDHSTEQKDESTESKIIPALWQGAFIIDPQNRFRIAAIEIEGQNGLSDRAALLEQLNLGVGQDLNAERVLTAQSRLERLLARRGCHFSMTVTHSVILDEADHSATIIFHVEQSGEAVFGAVDLQGAESVRRSYLRNHLPWREGDCFRRDQIESFRARLFETGLFASVETIMPDDLPADNVVPIEFILKERAPRTISTGLGYYTDEGILTTLGWEHRNFLGAGELMRAQLNLSGFRQNIETDFNKPFFFRRDQSLALTGKFGRENFDSFSSTGITAGAAIKRQLNRRLSVSTGVGYSLSQIRDKATNKKDEYGLVSLPQTANYDSRNDILDPTRCWLLNAKVAPFFDMLGESDPFFKTELSARTYVSLNDSTVFALRGKMGSLLGSSTVNIPPTERYYAGGGGSVRGFGFQEVGPQRNNKPLGGRSIAELSGELRFKLSNDYGAVLFIDTASLSDKTTPDFRDIAVGAGVGFRYYSDFGPIRFDIGAPIRNKENTSRNFQFYISIGQAF